MNATAKPILQLAKLKTDIPALTEPLGSVMIEACIVCFEDQGHTTGTELEVIGDYRGAFIAIWQGEVTQDMRRAWRDEEFAPEIAACGIAILLVEEITGYTVLEAASRGERIDYWPGERNSERRAARLEVSGLRQGNISRIEERVRLKALQTELSDSDLPVYIIVVIVVEFGRPRARMVTK